MTRFQADTVLLFVAIIWGTAFVAQKGSFEHVGPWTFVAFRFLLSFVLVAPLAYREIKNGLAATLNTPAQKKDIWWLCPAFAAGVVLQQVGIGETTVTNAGFLTGLYVLFVPVICALFFKQKLSAWIFPAAFISLAGLFLLVGGHLDGFSGGDLLIIASALGFAVQVALVGRIMTRSKAPFTLSCIQYAAVAGIAFLGMFAFETPTMEGLSGAFWQIVYAGAVSGAVAYTLQIVAQQYAPASDSAIILSGEALFAAIAGALLLGDRLSPLQYGGCALIAMAIIMVEFAPLLRRRKTVAA